MSYFDPGASPATTNEVFFDTEPAALPPRTMMASLASSRLNPVNDPVTTIDSPCRVGAMLVSRSSASRTPAARHLSTIARCQSTSNHSRSAAAMVGPTPSTSASCSSEAAMMASRLPKAVASARAAVGPTWRIDSDTRIRHSGRDLACSRFCSRRPAFADNSPSLVRKNSAASRSSRVRSNRSPSSAMTPALSRAVAAS